MIVKTLKVYSPMMLSRWIIAAPPGHVVRLSWLSFSLEAGHGRECDFDSVSVWDNSSIPHAGQS